MDKLVLIPLILPMFSGIMMIFLWNHLKWQKVLNLVSLSALLTTSLYLVHYSYYNPLLAVYMGGWKAPFGIAFVLDILSASMVFISSLIAWCAGWYCLKSMDEFRFKAGFLPLLQFLLMGVHGAFLTGDLFNLYVWYEVMLMASFVLLSLGGETKQLGGSLKYVIMNLIASLFFLSAMGLLFGKTGTLNMADMADKFSAMNSTPYIKSAFVLLFMGFAIKSALFPLFFWLPISYPVAPITIAAVFAGLLTKVGVYSFVRVATLMFGQDYEWLKQMLLFSAGFTMIIGVLGALSKNSMRKILSFHIISQIGYMIFGLAIFSVKGVAGCIFYIVHHIAVKSNLFFVAGAVEKIRQSDQLSKMGDLYKQYPLLSILFLIPALSLAGIPPLSGFFAKFSLIVAGIEEGDYLTVGVSLLVGLLTLFSMIKIWSEGFWKKSSPKLHLNELEHKKVPATMLFPIIVLALFTISMGVGAGGFFKIAEKAAHQVMNPKIYINTVLGRGGSK
jgi:multicomponent Na+:H+ antiporter subunit D